MKKAVAVFVAFAIVLGLTPGLLNLKVEAASASAPEIIFKEIPPDASPSITTIIRGSTAVVEAKTMNDTDWKTENPILITKPPASPVAGNPSFSVTDGGSNAEKTITPIPKQNLTGTPTPVAAVGDYSLTTNHIAFQAVAISLQKLGGGAAGTMEFKDAKLPIITTSVATLKYTPPSGNTQALWEFIIPTGADAGKAGIFAGWLPDVNGGLKTPGTTPGTERYELILTNSESGPINVDFYPNAQWVEMTDDPNVPDDPNDPTADDTIPVTHYSMNASVPNEFEIRFNYADSNPLVLQVRDPREVLESIVDQATDPSKEKNSYVKLKGETDQFYYITDGLILTPVTTIHRERANLLWEWVPDVPGAADQVMKIDGGGDEPRDVMIFPLEEDTYGTLKVTASFPTKTLNDDVMFGRPDTDVVTKNLPVMIRGLGKPAFPDYVTKTIGGVDGGADTVKVERYGEGKDLPSTIYNMDIYKNGVNGFEVTEKPYRIDFTFNAGELNGLTRRMIVDAKGSTDSVSATIKMGPPTATGGTEYKFGDNFDGITGSGLITVSIVALEKAPENLNLTFRFFVTGINNSLREETTATQHANIGIGDSSPDTTAELSEFRVTDQEGKIALPDFAFEPKKYDYTDPIVEVPNEMSVIRIKPETYLTTQPTMGYKVERMNDDRMWEDVTGVGSGEAAMAPSGEKKWIEDWSNQLPDGQRGHSITSGNSANRLIKLIPNVPMRITIKVRAQDPNIVKSYVFVVRRQMPSTDSSLKTLTVIGTKDGEDFADGFTPMFAPDVYEGYDVVVPYNVEEIRAEFDTNHPKAEGKQIDPEMSLLSRIFGKGDNIKLPEPTGIAKDDAVEVKILVKSQSSLMPVEPWWGDLPEMDSGSVKDEYNSTYAISVRRALPGRDATIASLEVSDKEDKPLTYTPAFKPDTEDGDYYELPVPYSVSEIKLTAATTHKYASMKASGEGFSEIELKSGKASKPIPVKWYENGDPHIITITATAEDRLTTKTYELHLLRAAPSTEASLVSLDIKDQEGASLSEFAFNTETTDYQLSVPYETRKVTFTPKATSAFVSEIKVDGRKVADGQPSRLIDLPEYPNVKTVVVEVVAEDGTTKMSYRVSISRQAPSNDARLSALSATGLLDNKLTPVFAPKTLSYSATLIENAPGVTITAVTVSPYATLTIDGKKAISGTASEQILILDETQAVQIVVTAQDGKTKNTYRINFKNPNLIPKSSNADLARLKVNYGEMQPGFKPSITGYEIYVKEDEYSVDIMPRAADKGAEVKVFAGSKEIGDEDGNFSQSIADGENDFLVRVTSSDKTKTKEYSLLVYRNEEDKQGSLRPITADDIDYENSGDVIIVDITKYSRVAANVFTELKNYPEKTIIFEGNDYSLQFSAAELDKVIPVTAVYDFKMSFNSPIANEVYDEIDRYRSNRRADTVLVHFGYDGVLPGPATLTMSLGKRYRNDTYYWHYYNEERGRLDYYGSFKTNSKGTFTVPLNHMSTYVIADIKLYGSEDKSGGILDIGEQAEIEKLNPDTGVLGGNR